MRSAELSGVGSRGFGRVLAGVSPLTYAVAIAAFIAASIFVIADAFRTFEDIAEREALMERLGAAQPLLRRQFVATAFEPVVVEVDSAASVSGLVQRGGIAYVTATRWDGKAGMRAAFDNWATTAPDVLALQSAVERALHGETASLAPSIAAEHRG